MNISAVTHSFGILICTLLLLLLPKTAAATCNTAKAGDLTGDGITDIVDVQCAVNVAFFQQQSLPVSAVACANGKLLLADANCDLSTDIVDVLIYLKWLVKSPLDPDLDANGDNFVDICQNSPATPELCNGIDDDCDFVIDEGFNLGIACDGPDGDACKNGILICNGLQTGTFCQGDTNSPEICNGLDDDCDGQTDEGFVVGVACDGPDADKCKSGLFVCNAAGNGTVCDETVHHVETCNGVDDDCDGETDELNADGCVLHYLDQDNDGFGNDKGNSVCSCGPYPPWIVTQAGDCYDANTKAFPGAGVSQAVHRGDGSFDYNCDGKQTKYSDYIVGPCYLSACSWGDVGWVDIVPPCGGTGIFRTSCSQWQPGYPYCSANNVNSVQYCL